MYDKLYELCDLNKIKKSSLLNILRNESKTLNMNDIINASNLIISRNELLQDGYREHYNHIYLKYFVLRTSKLKNDYKKYSGIVVKEDFISALDLLKQQHNNNFSKKEINKDSELYNVFKKSGKVDTDSFLYKSLKSFSKIYGITCLYTTFVLNEPIHPIGTIFPGNFKVKYEDNEFKCPVKRNNENNQLAVCKFCLAIQDESVYL